MKRGEATDRLRAASPDAPLCTHGTGTDTRRRAGTPAETALRVRSKKGVEPQ